MDDKIVKLIDILPSEHIYLLNQIATNQEPFMILCDNSYNDYNIDDYVKTDYGTFWKITGITYCFRFTENPVFDECCWETKEKLRKNQATNGQREYSILFVEKVNYNTVFDDSSSESC